MELLRMRGVSGLDYRFKIADLPVGFDVEIDLN
jgi:hypothetical protein